MLQYTFSNKLLAAAPLLSLLMMTGFKPADRATSVADSPAKQDLLNVAYGNLPQQKMDVFLPAGRSNSNTKVLVFVHGGSWNAGDKAEFSSAIKVMREQLTDFAFFNINYRLARNPNNIYPAQINDLQKALEYITGKSQEYQVDATRIALVGASAGAHLALLQAYKYNNDQRIKAVVDLFGPTDLNELYFNHPFPSASQPVLNNFLGTSPQLDVKVYKKASPVNFVTAQTVPTLIFHGESDYVVPVNQSKMLKAKLDAVNVKAELTIYPGAGHGWFDSKLIDTYSKTISFIRQHVR